MNKSECTCGRNIEEEKSLKTLPEVNIPNGIFTKDISGKWQFMSDKETNN